jgi:hypothetical protein
LSCVPLSDLHFPIPFFLHCFSIFSRCKHPRTNAIRQHNYTMEIAIFDQDVDDQVPLPLAQVPFKCPWPWHKDAWLHG